MARIRLPRKQREPVGAALSAPRAGAEL